MQSLVGPGRWIAAPETMLPTRTAKRFTALLAVVALATLVSHAGASGDRWYQAALDHGETQGYRWGVSAKLPKHKPLDEICLMVAYLVPPDPDIPYVEEDDTAICGSLKRPTESVSLGVTLGSSGAQFQAALYSPIVRKVVFLLSTGERRVFRPRAPRIPNRKAMGIPSFGYVIAPIDGGACVRAVTTFDRRGDRVSQGGESCSGRARA
jgi:hypothetical protein